jgi:hypothetical protein
MNRDLNLWFRYEVRYKFVFCKFSTPPQVSVSYSLLVDGTVTGEVSTLSGKGLSAAEILDLFNLSV